jgi:hypothetical protein
MGIVQFSHEAHIQGVLVGYHKNQQVQLGSHRVFGKSVDIPLMESIT